MSTNAAGRRVPNAQSGKIILHLSNTNTEHSPNENNSHDGKLNLAALYFQIRNLPRKTGFSTVEVNANFLFTTNIRFNLNLRALVFESELNNYIPFVDNAPRNDVCSEREGN